MAYMKPTFNHFHTSFLTTLSLLDSAFFDVLYIYILTFSSKRILGIQIEGLIPFRSSIDYVIAFLQFLRISSSFCSSRSVNLDEMMIGFAFYCCKKAYFKCSGNSF